jgi:hypothetical protein
MRLKLNGTDHLLSYADVGLLRDNIDTIKKNTKALIDTSKVGLEINPEETICCFLISRMQSKLLS